MLSYVQIQAVHSGFSSLEDFDSLWKCLLSSCSCQMPRGPPSWSSCRSSHGGSCPHRDSICPDWSLSTRGASSQACWPHWSSRSRRRHWFRRSKASFYSESSDRCIILTHTALSLSNLRFEVSQTLHIDRLIERGYRELLLPGMEWNVVCFCPQYLTTSRHLLKPNQGLTEIQKTILHYLLLL